MTVGHTYRRCPQPAEDNTNDDGAANGFGGTNDHAGGWGNDAGDTAGADGGWSTTGPATGGAGW